MDQRGLARAADPGHAGEHAQGDGHVDVFQVVGAGPRDADALAGAPAPLDGHGNGQVAPEVLGRQRARVAREPVERALVDHPAAVLAGAEPHVDDVVGDGDHVGVVLDDQHGVALVAQLPQDGDEPQVVARVQADRGLVEHVQRVDQRRAERGRQVDALGLPARQRRRQAIEREVVQPHIGQELEPARDLAQDLVGDRGVLVAQRERPEERLRLADGQRGGLVDGAGADAHVAGLAAQPRAGALRARQVAAIPAEEDAHVHLVLLPFEPGEEAADPGVLAAVALDDDAALGVGQILPGRVEVDAQASGLALERGQLRAVVRLGPWLDGAAADRLGGVGHHQVEVQLDDVAEPVARRAGAKRVVEREQARLRRLVGDLAPAAFEPLGELVPDGRALARQLHREGRPPALPIGRLDRIGEAGPRVAVHLDAIDDHLDAAAPRQQPRVGLLERHGAALQQQPAKAPLGQALQRLGQRIDPPRAASRRLQRVALLQVGRRRLIRHAHHGHLEPDQEASPLAQRRQAPRHDLGRFAGHLGAAAAAERPPDARPQQAHVVEDLGGGPHGGPGVADAVLLADGDGRADPVDAIDVGLLHPLEELAGVRRQRLDVPALALGVDRVKRQAGLARAADAGDDHQLSQRQRHVGVFQIVRACAAHHQPRGRGEDRFRHQPTLQGLWHGP